MCLAHNVTEAASAVQPAMQHTGRWLVHRYEREADSGAEEVGTGVNHSERTSCHFPFGAGVPE